MAKLNVAIDVEFVTDALLIRRDSERAILSRQETEQILSGLSPEDIGVEIVSTNADAGMSIPISLKDGKKGAILEVTLSADGAGLFLRCKGNFSVTLRRGADSLLKDLGDALDLRLRAVIGKGGYYGRGGFTAPVRGSDFDQETTDWKNKLPAISNFGIK